MQLKLSQRIDLLVKLGQYVLNNDEEFKKIKETAFRHNGWFVPEFIDLSLHNIATQYLSRAELMRWTAAYPQFESDPETPKTVGIVMAGNIPLVGFHDLLCVFISGNHALIKTSSKDDILIRFLAEKLIEWAPELRDSLLFSEMLKGCDAYIATGSNSTANHFEYYFGKYPHIIRKNRTSLAILSGHETKEELESLADDVHLYFGMGCRNITKIYVPQGYHFEPLVEIFRKYNYLSDVHKFKNNIDYNLAIHVLNNQYYMATDALLLVEDKSLFAPVGQLNYEFYSDADTVIKDVKDSDTVQCIVGKGFTPFGQAQNPAVNQYADGVDTMQFLIALSRDEKNM